MVRCVGLLFMKAHLLLGDAVCFLPLICCFRRVRHRSCRDQITCAFIVVARSRSPVTARTLGRRSRAALLTHPHRPTFLPAPSLATLPFVECLC